MFFTITIHYFLCAQIKIHANFLSHKFEKIISHILKTILKMFLTGGGKKVNPAFLYRYNSKYRSAQVCGDYELQYLAIKELEGGAPTNLERLRAKALDEHPVLRNIVNYGLPMSDTQLSHWLCGDTSTNKWMPDAIFKRVHLLSAAHLSINQQKIALFVHKTLRRLYKEQSAQGILLCDEDVTDLISTIEEVYEDDESTTK